MREGCIRVPADRLADRYQEILGLLRNREGLHNNTAVLRVDPNGSSRVVSPQVKPRKVVLLEDMGNLPALLLLIRNSGVLLSVLLSVSEFAS